MWYGRRRPEASELEETEEGLLQSEKLDRALKSKTDQKDKSCTQRLIWGWVLQSVMLVGSLTLLILSWYGEPSEVACTRKMFPYSPALEAVEYHDETLQGEFMQPSPFRGTPTPEIDARWEEIADGNAFNVASDKIHLLNKSSSEPWHHTDPKFGGGIAAQSWGYHQLHCLNLLRQASFEEEYRKSERLPEILRVTKEVRRNHLDHCIEVLRLDMMCQADVTPYFVMEPAPGDTSDALRIDFSVFKKCRDWGKIKDWMRDQVAIQSIRDTFLDELGHGGHG
ncbi:oxidase ustYa family protein [Aspergillus ibericus CBS 121593]|uniref:Tat pathway signal sequence n=1 Tax=Aspergillus ibericus CBS 121593 TaxID=1448316 RepID=A0A395H146_9EURO|nr:hypothetical protein BO80DRAFT_426080 [Aspergillus ibericus CBS 121593]RAL00024.1 hypothetical protein BO80DRAFT_426080 [Aspergillus ibericus CBS 121593]